MAAQNHLKQEGQRGEKEHLLKIAQTKVGEVAPELIHPVEGESIYKEFLREKGEGLHHIAFHEPGDEQAMPKEFKERGIKIWLSA